ncbi:MAG: hypothetical protein V7L11_02280 [Nostoc sp.]|uniref:hypothetical protein n=1 Tax=Nostoc sp. TaxID=1180 RepID=UPI002FF9C5CA
MRHRASPNFWYCYRQLPSDVQEFADRCYELLKQDPRYPSLHFKKVGRFWSVRVGLHYRALDNIAILAEVTNKKIPDFLKKSGI